ncbi:MAG TPA: hypothetical protein PLS28_04390 [Clostridiales bacterium]|nr:hypothetical protein [Clostridiales bacterium]
MKRKILIVLLALVLLFSFAGCSCKSKKAQEKEAVESTEDIIKQQDALKDGEVKLVEEDGKLCYLSDAATIVFYYEGDKITGHEMYVDYNDADTAKMAYQAIEQVCQESDDYESVSLKGNYVIMKYAKSEYDGMTVAQVKEEYKNFKQMMDVGEETTS